MVRLKKDGTIDTGYLRQEAGRLRELAADAPGEEIRDQALRLAQHLETVAADYDRQARQTARAEAKLPVPDPGLDSQT